MRLFITGMKHSGKSSFAPMVASRLGLPCADSDELLGQLTGGRSVRDFYAQEGKEAFMAAEYAAVAAYIGQTDSFVLALGGGAADNARLMDLMASSGTIVYLRRAEDDLLERVQLKDEGEHVWEAEFEAKRMRAAEAAERVKKPAAKRGPRTGSVRSGAPVAENRLVRKPAG